ncbi:MAG: replication initiation protein [Bdellovibrionales bacterium]|nr:replication initiation protein [Bdellovibrionales bacterium]
MSANKSVQIVKKDNRLIEAKYKLSIHQQRVLFTLLEKIHSSDDDFMHYDIDIGDIAEKFGLENSKALYSQMQEAISDLVTKKITIQEGDQTVVMAWLSYARYTKGQGMVEISFHKDLKPYLLQLKNHFTQYQLSAVARFKSSYSIRFYELLKMNEYLGKGGQFYRKFCLKELRDYLQIDAGKYENFKDLRVFVLESSIREINEYSDITVTNIEYLKKGRAVSDINITAEPKNQMMIDITEDAEEKTEVKEDKTEALQALLEFGISEDTANKWLDRFDSARIMRNIAYTRARQKEGNINSPVLYLSKAVQDDNGLAWYEQQQQKNNKKNQEAEKNKAVEDKQAKILEQERKEFDRAVHIFEELSEFEQDVILDQVEAKLKNLEKARFVTSRAAGTAHKERNYALHFKTVLIENGFDLTT